MPSPDRDVSGAVLSVLTDVDTNWILEHKKRTPSATNTWSSSQRYLVHINDSKVNIAWIYRDIKNGISFFVRQMPFKDVKTGQGDGGTPKAKQGEFEPLQHVRTAFNGLVVA